ncbi:MAG: hypothetical protein ACYDHF_00510 [Candidatus Cryosericum sp.]
MGKKWQKCEKNISVIMNARNRSRITESGDKPEKSYDETANAETGVGRAMRDADPRNGVKAMTQPKGRL